MLAARSEDRTNRSPLATCNTEWPQTGSTLLWHVPNHLSEEKIATTYIPDKFYLIHTPCPAGKPVNIVTIHILPELGVMLLKPIMHLQWLRFCRIVETCSVPSLQGRHWALNLPYDEVSEFCCWNQCSAAIIKLWTFYRRSSLNFSCCLP